MMNDFNLLSTEFIPLSEVKAKLSEQVRKVMTEGKQIAITSNGRPKAVILAYEDFLEMLQKLGDQPTTHKSPLKIIHFKEWKQQQPKRKMISDSIKKLFDTTGLTRKGQKTYKQKKVKLFGIPNSQ